MAHWLSSGASASKLVLGLPFYGRGFTLASRRNTGIYAPTSGSSAIAMPAYSDICKKQADSSSGWRRVWDSAMQVPYAIYDGNQWVGYDDAESLGRKIDFALRENLAGVMIWSVEQDDVDNICGDGKNSLLHYVSSRVRLGESSGGDQSGSGGSPPAPPPPPESGGEGDDQTGGSGSGGDESFGGDGSSSGSSSGGCQKAGVNPGPDCKSFLMCSPNGSGGFTPYTMSCGAVLVFNPAISACDWPANVPGCA